MNTIPPFLTHAQTDWRNSSKALRGFNISYKKEDDPTTKKVSSLFFETIYSQQEESLK